MLFAVREAQTISAAINVRSICAIVLIRRVTDCSMSGSPRLARMMNWRVG